MARLKPNLWHEALYVCLCDGRAAHAIGVGAILGHVSVLIVNGQHACHIKHVVSAHMIRRGYRGVELMPALDIAALVIKRRCREQYDAGRVWRGFQRGYGGTQAQYACAAVAVQQIIDAQAHIYYIAVFCAIQPCAITCGVGYLCITQPQIERG